MGQFLDLFVRFSHVFFISNCCNADPKDVQETLELCRPKEELRQVDASQADLQEESVPQDIHEESVSSPGNVVPDYNVPHWVHQQLGHK